MGPDEELQDPLRRRELFRREFVGDFTRSKHLISNLALQPGVIHDAAQPNADDRNQNQ